MTRPQWGQQLLTEEEYLAFDAASDRPNEFWFGRVFRREGESCAHLSIAAQLTTLLCSQKGKTSFHAGGSLLRVRMDEPRCYAYPDILIWDQKAIWLDDTLSLPFVLAEIVSPLTRERDRIIKLEHYRRLPSLSDYLIVSQARIYIEHYSRSDQNDVWINRSYNRRDQIIELRAVGIQLPVADIYFDVDVPEQSTFWDEEDG